MNEHLVHLDDCEILRDYSPEPHRAVLFTRDGDQLWSVPDTWTDEQIWAALQFANRAYAMGYRSGVHHKMLEIRQALGILTPPEHTDD